MAKTAKWAKIEDAQQRLGVAETAKGYDNSDIEERLIRAEERIRAKLQAIISSDTMDAWTQNTVPPEVKNWVADFAASFVLADYFGQPLMDKTTKAGSLFAKVEQDLKQVRLGEIQIVDVAGDAVAEAEETIWSDKQDRTSMISMTHPDDSDAGDGSLDEL